MRRNKQISTKQIRGLLVSSIIGIGIMTLPQELALILENDGWIAIIGGGLLIVPMLIIIDRIFKLFPGKNMVEIGNEIYGKKFNKVFLIIILLYFLIFMGFLVRSLGEMTKAFLLKNTPTEIIIIGFIVATSYIARTSIQIIGRASYHIYPIIIGFIVVLTILSLQSIDFTNMLPVFQSDMSNFPKGILTSFFSYTGFELLFFVIPFAEEKDKTLKASLTSLGIVMVIYLILFCLSLSQFGIHNLKRQTFPTLSIIKEIDLPGYFIENLDGFVMAIWVLVAFGTMAPAYYASGRVVAHILNTKNHDLFILPLMPIIYIISLTPQNTRELSESLGRILNYIGIVTIIIFPIMAYIVGYYKVRREKK